MSTTKFKPATVIGPVRTLYIGNLPFDTTEAEVGALFEAYGGQVEECTLLRDAKTGHLKGFGYVRMSTSAQARRALVTYSRGEDLLLGRRLMVDMAAEDYFASRYAKKESIVAAERSSDAQNHEEGEVNVGSNAMSVRPAPTEAPSQRNKSKRSRGMHDQQKKVPRPAGSTAPVSERQRSKTCNYTISEDFTSEDKVNASRLQALFKAPFAFELPPSRKRKR